MAPRSTAARWRRVSNDEIAAPQLLPPAISSFRPKLQLPHSLLSVIVTGALDGCPQFSGALLRKPAERLIRQSIQSPRHATVSVWSMHHCLRDTLQPCQASPPSIAVATSRQPRRSLHNSLPQYCDTCTRKAPLRFSSDLRLAVGICDARALPFPCRQIIIKNRSPWRWTSTITTRSRP